MEAGIPPASAMIDRLPPAVAPTRERDDLVAGFRRGRSTMDRNVMLGTGGGIMPPGVLEDEPLWGVGLAGKVWQATEITGGRGQ